MLLVAGLAAALTLGAAGPGLDEAAAAQAGGDKVRIAILNVENNSTWSWWGDNLGYAAADELATQLVKSGQFSIIERQQLEAILAEQELGQSGLVNAATAAEVGKLLGAQLILTGSITQFSIETMGGGIGPLRAEYSQAESKIDLRLVNTNTGEIMAVVEGEGDKRFGGAAFKGVDFRRDFDAGVAQEALRPAVEDAVGKLLDQAGDLADLAPVIPPANIVGSGDAGLYIDQGQNYGVEVGQRYGVYRVIDEITDADGNVLDRVTEKVGVIQVSRVLSQSSICTIVEGEAAEGDQVRPEDS